MKLQTPDKSELIEIESISRFENGLLIEGMIMGAMPMKAVLTPAQLRRGLRFANLSVIFRVLAMLIRGR